MSPDVPDHEHCRWCGDEIPADQAWCSIECHDKDMAAVRKEKYKDLFWSAAALIGVAVILALGLIF